MVNGEAFGEKFLSRAEFAALQGWSPSYVTKLGHQGRLAFAPHNPKLIDVEATLANLAASADPRKAYLRQHHTEARVRKHVTSLINSDAPSDEQEGGGGAASGSQYWKSRALRESHMAELAELELARQRRELVERSRVEAAAEASHRLLYESLMGILAQLAPALATLRDPFQVEATLRDALRKVLADVANAKPEALFTGDGTTTHEA